MSCSAVRLEKPTGPQTVKKLPAILEPNIHYRFDNCPPFSVSPVHASSYILILFYYHRLGTPNVRFLSGVHIKELRELLSTLRIIWPAKLIIFDIFTPLIFPNPCPMFYLQMHRVMLHFVTTIQQNSDLNRRTLFRIFPKLQITSGKM